MIHRGLLYSSGLVAGEAIMGILIAVWVLAGLPTPILKSWSQQGGFLLEIVSLVGLLAIVVALIVKCLRRRD